MTTSIWFLPSVPLKDRKQIPREVTGVYYCTSGLRVLYVGKSEDIHMRWNGRRLHHKLDELKRYRNVRIYWRREPSWRYEHMEAKEIKRLKPKLNRRNEPLNPLLSLSDAISDVVFAIGFSVVAAIIIGMIF